ncbi:hypothetical protein CCAX7_31470 [Capsulimonas corticalis]|uniref:Uncharacterized protein n=1 Tax=Capsulimonas corticalis TaxID=2219043 RepID=A0A402CSG8_9BACT|nr:vitamin K epoxide reductase family protein [Capsulimonas corticalis]BDI31096.1 hypothetical protein CCAX7_31470 [Capsulimonas corticalis]
MLSARVAAALTRCYIAQIVLGFIGAAIAGALWVAHRVHYDLPCSANGGCEVVAESAWAHMTIGPFHDIPIALLGLLAYIAILTFAMMKIGSDTAPTKILLGRLGLLIILGGAGYSWYLQYVSHVKIGAFCPYCFSSACVMLLLLISAIIENSLLRRQGGAHSPSPEGEAG